MKAKWMIPILLLLILAASITFPVTEVYSKKLTIESDSLRISTGAVTAKLSGKVTVENVQLIFKRDTLNIAKVELYSSLPKLYRLQKRSDELFEQFEKSEWNTCERELGGSFRKMRVTGISGTVKAVEIQNAALNAKSFGRTFKGTISAPAFRLWSREQRDGKIRFKSSSKEIELAISARVAGGDVKAKIAGDKETNLWEYSLDGKRLHLETLFPDSLQGVGKVAFRGRHTSLEDATGEGVVSVQNFYDNQSSVLTRLRSTLSYVGVDTVQFESVTVPLFIDSSRVYSDSIVADGELFSVYADGQYRLKSGYYSYDVTGVLDSAKRSDVSKVVWNGLLADTTTGERSFNGTLRGSGKRYTVQVDQKVIKRSVKSFFKGIFK